MGSTQLYSLTWGGFGTSLVSAVQLLRCHGELVDVTLAAGGRSFPAHKIVLCAASPFLFNLLKSTPCQHPVVMLAGVTAPDLEALLEFVYRGEVSVDSSQLPSLLQAAHCLNIQGLSPGSANAEKPDEVTTISSAHEALTRDVINSFLPLRRRKRTKPRDSTGSQSKWAREDGMSSDADAENRPLESNSGPISLTTEPDVLNIPDVPRKTEDDNNSQSVDDAANLLPAVGCTGSGGGKVRGASDQPGMCPLCGSMLRQARNLRRHLLTSCKYRMMGPAVGMPPGAVCATPLTLSSSGIPVGSINIPTLTVAQQHMLLESDLQLQQRLSVSQNQQAILSQSQQQQQSPEQDTQQNQQSQLPGSPGHSEVCEQIVCKVSPLPSPMSSCSNLMSPGCSIMSPQPSVVPPQ